MRLGALARRFRTLLLCRCGALALRFGALTHLLRALGLLLRARRRRGVTPALGTLALFFGWRGPLLNARTGLDRRKGALLAPVVRPRLPLA